MSHILRAIALLLLAWWIINAALTLSADAIDPPIATENPDPIVIDFADWVEEDAAENEHIEEALLSRAHAIENCTITYYCAERRPHICGTGDGITASGLMVQPYVSCAVDPRIIPLGSDVMVDYGDGELHYYRADDIGGGVKGDHIDLCVSSHKEALNLGVTTATVYWVEAE